MNLDILKGTSSQDWLEAVMNDFDSFLQDHADCERKASAMALSFVAKYPDRVEIIPDLIDTAVEELQHFRQVYKIMEKRNVPLPKEMNRDVYVRNLIDLCRTTRNERFMDRLILASVVEWRGCERFKMVADNLKEEHLAKFYQNLWESEARHGVIFIEMAKQYFPTQAVEERMQELLEEEIKVLNNLEIKAALH